MSYPTTRRFFRDDEFRNENAAIAGLVRGLALWENHTWARDLVLTPADPKVHGDLSWPWSATSFFMTPNRSVGAGYTLLARFPVSDPRAPANRIKLYVDVAVAGAGTLNGLLTVTNLTTGEATTQALNAVAIAPGHQWFSTTVPAAAGDVLEVSAGVVSGLAFTATGLCAWWDPDSLSLPGVTFTAGWTALSQAYHTTDRPLSTYALRQLGRAANAFVHDRPLPVVASWLYNPAAGVGAGYASVPLVVGRYMLPIGARVSQMELRLRYRASGACSVTCALSGGGSASAVISGAGYGVASATITRTAGAFSAEELTLTVAGSPTYCDIEHVLVYEQAGSATDLALPSGETVPGNFDHNLDERLLSGRAIRADDVARLVANMVHLWSHRRCRVLVNDCRFSYKESETFDFTGVQGATNKAALHAIPLVNLGSGFDLWQVRVRAGWNACQINPTATDEVLLQVGELASGDYAGSTPVGLGADPGTGAYGQANWQHRWGSTPGAPAVYEFETHIAPTGAAANNARSTRPSWTVLEQLPLNSPALTYP